MNEPVRPASQMAGPIRPLNNATRQVNEPVRPASQMAGPIRPLNNARQVIYIKEIGYVVILIFFNYLRNLTQST